MSSASEGNVEQVSDSNGSADSAAVMQGTVKWFNDAKGFGFIEHIDGKDVFVHYSVIQTDGYKSLKDGEIVEYEIKQGPKGMHATRVSRMNPPQFTEKAKAAKPIKYNPDSASGDDEATDDNSQEHVSEQDSTSAAN